MLGSACLCLFLFSPSSVLHSWVFWFMCKVSFSIRVQTTFSSDLQSHVGKGPPGPGACKKSCSPLQGCLFHLHPCPLNGALASGTGTWSHPQTTFSLRPSRPSPTLLILLSSISMLVVHHSVCGPGHSHFPGGCSGLLSGPHAFTPTSLHSTL